jgi:hypothetical protein
VYLGFVEMKGCEYFVVFQICVPACYNGHLSHKVAE